MARVLFIHTFDYYEPLGIMQLSACLKQHGHSCELLDLKFIRNYIAEVNRIKPDVVAYSVTTNNWKRYLNLNRSIKEHHHCISLFGGPHVTFFPEFINNQSVDIICRGEGEEAIVDLCNAIDVGSDFTGIQNLWVKCNEQIVENPLRPLIENLDTLPFADRDLINKYELYRKRSRVRTMTSRGCPYNCTYCFNHSNRQLYQGLGSYVRQRSPKHVIDELLNLKKLYQPRNFEFHDDIFIVNRLWVKEFVDLYIEHKINTPFEINVRIDMVDDEIAMWLKQAGCYSVQFGIESGNVETRKKLLKRNISNQQIVEASLLFRKIGIKTNAFNLVGLPGETLNDVLETIRLNAASKTGYSMNSIYQPYPGTQLAAYALEHHYYDGRLDTFDKNYLYGRSVIHTPDIRRIERLHYLFAFGARWPRLIPAIRLLSALRCNKLYQSWYYLYRAYFVIFVFRRLSLREVLLRFKFIF